MDGSDTRRLVILGRTGAGKSSLANTVFGEKLFRVSSMNSSETSKCEAKTKSVSRRSLTLIDTPVFFGTNRSEEDLKSEILRCITECSPGPHAFLIVLKVERYDEYVHDVINKIQQYFSDEAFKYATVVFTHGEQLDEGLTIEDFVHQNNFLSVLVQKCGGRCHVIDSKYWNKEHEYRSNEVQVEKLLKTIDKMVEEHNGGCYTKEMLKAVQRTTLQQGYKHNNLLSGNISKEEIRKRTNASRIRKLSIRQAGSDTRRLVILGKTGAGKSSLANTVFGEKLFDVSSSACSETSKCKAKTKTVNGRSLTLIDTPGFFDTNRSEEDLKPEILRCIIESSPGPHAFLIVLKVERYTEHEQDVVNKIVEYFSDEAFKYAAVVFTHGEQLDEGLIIEDFVQSNKCLIDLVQKCGGWCHVIDNKYWNKEHEYRSNEVQVEKLLKTIDKMVEENNEEYYSNEMLQEVEKQIQQEQERIRQQSGNMSEEETRERTKRCLIL